MPIPTRVGQKIDSLASDAMNIMQERQGISLDDLRVNKRLYNEIDKYRIPDLYLPNERVAIDGTIGRKTYETPQVRDIFESGKVDKLILVSPNKSFQMLTREEYLLNKAGKT